MSTITKQLKNIRGKRRQELEDRLERIKNSLMMEFIRRIKAGEQSGPVLAELNAKWVKTCKSVGTLEETYGAFVRTVDENMKTVEAVVRQQRLGKWLGRVAMVVIVVAISAGTYAAIEFMKVIFNQ